MGEVAGSTSAEIMAERQQFPVSEIAKAVSGVVSSVLSLGLMPIQQTILSIRLLYLHVYIYMLLIVRRVINDLRNSAINSITVHIRSGADSVAHFCASTFYEYEVLINFSRFARRHACANPEKRTRY